MCQGNAQETLEKKAEPIQQQKQKQQTLQEHINSLFTWELQEGQTLEQARAQQRDQLMLRYTQDCTTLVGHVQSHLFTIQAEDTAAGAPIQEQVPQKQSWKQRREARKQRAKARKHHADADEFTYRAVKKIQKLNQGRQNSIQDLSPELLEQKRTQRVDGRMLGSFCQGYQKNLLGKPASPADQARKEADAKFLSDYISCDLQRRTPHLDNMVQQILDTDITKEMLQHPYILEHCDELKVLSDRLTYFDNVRKDPVNAPYFQAMDPYRLALLTAQFEEMYPIIGSTMTTRLQQKAVHLDHFDYVKSEDNIQQLYGFDQDLDRLYDQAAASRDRLIDQAAHDKMTEQFSQWRAALIKESDEKKADAQNVQELRHLGDLNLTGYVTPYSLYTLAEYRTMIEEHPEAYAAHKELVDNTMQELYRSVDAKGDLTLETSLTQEILSRYPTGGHTLEDIALINHTDDYQSQIAVKLSAIEQQLSGITELLDHILRGKELTDRARLQQDRLS